MKPDEIAALELRVAKALEPNPEYASEDSYQSKGGLWEAYDGFGAPWGPLDFGSDEADAHALLRHFGLCIIRFDDEVRSDYRWFVDVRRHKDGRRVIFNSMAVAATFPLAVTLAVARALGVESEAQLPTEES